MRSGCVGNSGELGRFGSVIFHRFLCVMRSAILKLNEEDHDMNFKATSECDAEHRPIDDQHKYYSYRKHN